MSKTTAQKLCELVNKKYVVFTSRGNASIKLILEILKMGKKYSKVLIQDQGGWLTYPQFIDKLKFEKIELKTEYGIVHAKDLEQFKDSIILLNSMPAYAFSLDMEHISEICKKNNLFLINDTSGSIGTEDATYGDVIFGSFGEEKPIEIGEGGFIATNHEWLYKELCELNLYKPSEEFLDKLDKKIDLLDDRLAFFDIIRYQVLNDLSAFNIIHPNERGINVIVKYDNELELNDILLYLKENNLEHTMCPRYIRVNCKAVSIEIKRAKQEEILDQDFLHPGLDESEDFEDDDADKRREIDE